MTEKPIGYCTLEQLAVLARVVPSEDRIPIYTAPPKHWQRLTVEEIEAIGDKVANEQLIGPVSNFRVRFARAIETRLKEKNHEDASW